MSGARERLFTPRFFVMCGFTFTVFLSAFQVLPSAPFRILELGGRTAEAGLFLGFLTYASALTAPVTGALADRLGKRRMLVTCSLVLAAFAGGYAVATDHRVFLALPLFQGVVWSGMLSASSAYMTDIIPESRRAEGIAYWGLSTILAIAVAPAIGFWLHGIGWTAVCVSAGALNLLMAGIALALPASETGSRAWRGSSRVLSRDVIEWRVLLASFVLFLYSFGYGGITSFVALYAERNGITPKGIYFTVFAAIIVVTRPFSGRLADRIGHTRVLLPSLALVTVGLVLLVPAPSRASLVVSALVFGAGFGTAYPAYAAHVVKHVDPARRGAAFGGILAAFDTGIGTGSMAVGWLVDHAGFPSAWTTAALLSALAIPYFLFADRRFLRRPGP